MRKIFFGQLRPAEFEVTIDIIILIPTLKNIAW